MNSNLAFNLNDHNRELDMWEELNRDLKIPSLQLVEATLVRNQQYLIETPVWKWEGVEKDRLVGAERQVYLKLELLQHSGSFKTRGALCEINSMTKEQLEKGVICVSAGNHGLAVSYTAKKVGTSAHVVMPKTASRSRITKCQDLGAKVTLTEDITAAFDEVNQIQIKEERKFIHPFDGPLIALGTATLGLEFLKQVPQLTSVIVPIGGGGLIAGISATVKRINPNCKVIGVEPEGANSLYLSFQSGQPVTLDRVNTIADSLAPPYAMAYSYGVARHFVDQIVTIPDHSIQRAMGVLFSCAKLAAEPAAATATAGLIEYLKPKDTGNEVGVIVCGSNIDSKRFCSLIDDSLVC